MSASSVCRAELFLCVLVTLGEETELVRLVELELMILLASGWTCSSELVLQDEKEELLCFLNEETQLTCLESSQLKAGPGQATRWSNYSVAHLK